MAPDLELAHRVRSSLWWRCRAASSPPGPCRYDVITNDARPPRNPTPRAPDRAPALRPAALPPARGRPARAHRRGRVPARPTRCPPRPGCRSGYRTSRITVRHALALLEQEGLVHREQGRGSFIRPRAIAVGPRRLTSFTQELRERGVRQGSVLSGGPAGAARPRMRPLDLGPSGRCACVERVRRADDHPIAHQVTWDPGGAGGGHRRRRSPRTGRCTSSCATAHGLEIDSADETYRVGAADAQAARAAGPRTRARRCSSWSGSGSRGQRPRRVDALRRPRRGLRGARPPQALRRAASESSGAGSVPGAEPRRHLGRHRFVDPGPHVRREAGRPGASQAARVEGEQPGQEPAPRTGRR